MNCFRLIALSVGILTMTGPLGVLAGPICCLAPSQTLSEEIDAYDVVVIAELMRSAPAAESPALPAKKFKIAKFIKRLGKVDGGDTLTPKARFKIVDIVKGRSLLENSFAANMGIIETVHVRGGKPARTFMILGAGSPEIRWSLPLALTDRARIYMHKIAELPREGIDRLEFFLNHLEDEDEILARDAYDELAKAPNHELQSLKKSMNHDRLVAWVQNKKVPASRRRLYFTMLGVCGGPADLPMLERLLQSKDRKLEAGLDAMIGCYLSLKGAEGMPLIEELFLKNRKAVYADTYSAIMALRFHGSETDVISRRRLLVGLRHMLDRPEIADLVVADLARWKDWSVMERLVELFKNSDENSRWVRVPVINYLRACPLPVAVKHLADLEKINPEAVKRASTFFPIGPAGNRGPGGTSS